MKIALSLLIFLLLNNWCYSQVDYSEHWVNSGWSYSNESDSIIDVSKKVINNKDLSYLLKGTSLVNKKIAEILPIYGLLGEGFNKIEFVFINIKKSIHNDSQYIIKGKTKLNDTINDFEGNITFEKATAYITGNQEEQTVVVLTGSYKLTEVSKENTAGIFIGKLKMTLFTNNIFTNDILFDMDTSYEDGAVRGFVGVRKGKESSQSCIWGFQRFPYQYANRFDIGTGEEVINLKYAKPWFNFSEQEWNSIINDENEDFYLHSDQEDKGIHTSNEAYIKPEETNWYKLNENDLEKTVIEQLKIDKKRISFITFKELSNNINEIVFVIGELEYDNSEEGAGDDYGLTSHILIVNSITGKIKIHFSENAEQNGWKSNAIFITEISIGTTTYKLTENQVAFGVKTDYRSSSQPNPYSNTALSLYIKEDNSLKKVLNNLTVDEYSGIVNVNTCYADIKKVENKLKLLASNTNGYYDIQVKNTDVNSLYQIDSEGECEPVEKSRVEKISILKYNNAKYE